ncbi:carbon-nitrogen hydrolase family protein [Corallincola platygyrae]|uniref:Carbon-nitrogen hydrolase family protein n=1 Tax=Corallincola platygyrae TaxID=1193278 RepID=A0ABW4XSX5_9GAMM
MRLTALQWVSSPDPTQNLSHLEKALDNLPDTRPQLVVLPENWACYGGGERQTAAVAELHGRGELQSALSGLAKKHGIWLAAGSLPILNQAADKPTATLLVYGPEGQEVGRYDKLHLFDVDVADAVGSYRESDIYQAGKQPIVIDTELGRVGLAICYDLRFPELFRWMRAKGAEVIVLPAAFTQVTGEAHWQTLLRARAIENQCYIVAADQAGVHANGRETYGHSLVIDPWGEVLAMQDKGVACVTVIMDREKLTQVRSNMPVMQHSRFFSHWDKES